MVLINNTSHVLAAALRQACCGGGGAIAATAAATAAAAVAARRATAATTTPTRALAIDAKYRGDDEAHAYLDRLFCLKGQTAAITGGAGAVGRAVALAFAKVGADVVIMDQAQAAADGEQLADELRALGRRAAFVACDVRDRASVDGAMRAVEQGFGSLEVLVANAGTLGDNAPPHEVSEEDWRHVMSVNVDGVFHAARAAYPLLKRSRNSKVVVTSSIAALYGYGQQAAYCASKGALLPLAKSLALAWAKDGIHVNCVLPGAANSPFTKTVLSTPERLSYIKERIPLGRLAEPEDLAGPIVFFASRASDYVTGTSLVVDGGGTARAMAQ